MKSTKMMYKRIMAFVLALVLMGSTFSGASVSAYATTGADIPVEVQTVEDTQDESEDEATVEKTEVVVADTESEAVDTEAVDTDTEDDVVVEDDANAEDNAVVENDTTVEDDADVEDDAAAEDGAVVEEDAVAEDEATVSENEIEDTVELASADGYTGEIYKGHLYIDIDDDAVDALEFTEEDLLAILGANDDETFDGIYIEQFWQDYPGGGKKPVIYESVVEKAATMLNENGYVEFYCKDGTISKSVDVIIWGPETEQSCGSEESSADITVSEGKGYLTFTNIPSVAAEDVAVQVRYWKQEEAGVYDSMIDAYGEEYLQIKIAEGDGYDVYGYYNVNTTYNYIEVYAGTVSPLTAGVPYEIRTYKGTVNEAGDTLTIDCDELENIEGYWSEDRIAEMINSYSDQKFDTINVTVNDCNRWLPEDQKLPQYTIDSAIYNAAVNHLSGKGEGLYYTINQEYYEDKTSTEPVEEGCTKWHFANPAKVSKDIVIGYDMSVSDTGFVNVTFDTPSTLGKTIVNVEDTFNLNYWLTSDLLNALNEADKGDGVCLYPLETQIIGYDWEWNDTDQELTVYMSNNVNSLVDNKTYTVNSKHMGDTGSNVLGDYLYISADMIGKDVFGAGELEDYLQMYENASFNAVYIHQREIEDTDNIIRKADFNAARKLLATDGSDTEIVFTFDDTERYEWDNGDGTVSSEEYPKYTDWSFYNPSEATADMKAEIEYDDYGYHGYDENDGTYYYGLTLEREKAAFPSSGVDVTLSKYYNYLDGVFGSDENIPAEADEFEPMRGLIFSNIAKLTEVNSELYYWFAGNEGVYKLQILDAQNLPTTECYAFPVKTDVNSPYGVGEEVGLSISGNLALKSYDPEVAYATSTKNEVSLSIVNQGEFTYAHAYTKDSRPIVDVYEAETIIKINDMRFVNIPKNGDQYELVMELPPAAAEEPWEVTYGLDLRLYPDSAGQYWEKLNWTISDETLAEGSTANENNVVDWTTNKGVLKAVNAGTATVTVSYTPADGEAKSITCNIVVKNAVSDEFSGENWDLLFADCPSIAIMNYDKTLADVELPTKGTWSDGLPTGFRWVDDTEKLSAYAGMSGHDFAAIYKSPIDGREAKVSVWVSFVSVDSVLADPSINSIMGVDEVNFFTPLVKMNNYAVEIGEEQYSEYLTIDQVNNLFKDCKLAVTLSPSFNATNGTVVKTETEDEKENGDYKVYFNKAGKNKVTISLMAAVGTAAPKELKKVTYSITVPKSDVVNWDNLVIWKKVSNDESTGLIGEQGVYYFAIPSEPDFKLTAKNLDTTVAKWDKATNGIFAYDQMPKNKWSEDNPDPEAYIGNIIPDEDYNYVKVPYTIIGEGFVQYSLQVNDELKSTLVRKFAVEYKDYLPRPQVSAVTINSKTDSKAGGLTWELETWEEAEEEKIADVGELKLTGKDADKFVISKGDVTGSILPITIQLADKKDEEGNSIVVKNGKYKLTVEAEVNVNEQPLEDPFTTEVTVTVTDKLPNVTVKQTKNVNLFYKDSEGDGFLTITTDSGQEITDVTIRGQKDADLDYSLMQIEDSNVYAIKWNKDIAAAGKNTKAELQVSIQGYTEPVIKTLNIKKENKAPVITLSQKSDTLYSNYMVGDKLRSILRIKVNGEPMNMTSYVKCNNIWIYPTAEPNWQDIPFKNNTYEVAYGNTLYDYDQGYVYDTIYISIDPETAKKSTDKFTFEVQEANWTNPVSISYSVKVDTSVPKLELGTKTITLNRNDAVFANQSVATTLQLKGGGVNLFDNDILKNGSGYWISYVGKDAKSIKYMVNDLIINYNDEGLIVRLHDNSIPKGTYKYDIKFNKVVGDSVSSVVTTLTVKVVEDAPEKCISVSGKSNIDVLDRANDDTIRDVEEYTAKSVATYTAKLKNMAGTVVDGYITGQDADKFVATFQDGKLIVKAREGAMFNTKTNYKVTPVFIVENAEGGSYELEGKEQKIKVKQGKPKVTMTSVAGNILYRGRTNELEVELDALLNKTEDVAINRVELAGNWDTFYIASFIGEFDEYDNPTDIKGLTISQHDNPGTIINNGKTVNLKFNVYFTDAAGNEKATSVTYKMVVK